MYSRVEKRLEEAFACYTFKGFSDHSPIAETYPASMAGLGVIGDMYQLINEKYGSHVFIGEIFTDLELESYDTVEPTFCTHCGACREACPSAENCLSGITQKKGELSEKEIALIRASGIVWGCDVCRTVCPLNRNVALTPIEFFRSDLTERVTEETIASMSKEEFKQRAYSWRGKNTILRNIMLLSD
jgi:epoxyqueuosine reductase QueG